MYSSDRRTFLQAAGALAGAALLAPIARAAPDHPVPAAGGPADSQLTALLATFADELLTIGPELATTLGLDSGARAALKSKLNDVSLASDKRDRTLGLSMHERLRKLDRAKLSERARLQYDTMLYGLDLGASSSAFAFGSNGYFSGFGGDTTPYVLSQQHGAAMSLPEFLNSQHAIKTAADAEAYVSRLTAFGTVLDQETERLRHDVAAGVVPPDFILSNAISQAKAFRALTAAQQGLVTSLVTRAGTAKLPGEWATRATTLVEKSVYPALDRQIAALEAAQPKANANAGVWKLKNGGDYYRWTLKIGTTTTMTASEIHAIGLEQTRAIQARMDGLLKAQNFTKGTVGERMLALPKDPRFTFANTDAGRAELISYVNNRIAAVRPLLAKVSKLGLKADVTVKRVPPDIQDGAPLGYMNFASLDGSRPAIYYINLKNTSLWPKYEIPTLSAHEGVPGHTWQGAYLAEHHNELPLISSMMGFNAFVEGWALYAEQLTDELGYYADDPFGQLGYLQAQNFRACRLVVDTGLHDKRWTREQAVSWMVANCGRGQAAITSEVDRYCASPGQACGYKVGHNELLRLRDKAKTALGARFDLRDYNDVVVSTCGVPLTVLATVIDGYIARTKG